MATNQAGAVKVVFGTQDELWGLVTGVSNGRESEVLDVKNGAGDIIDFIFHGIKDGIDVDCEFLVEDTPTGPAVPDPIGEEVTFKLYGTKTVNGFVQSVSKKTQRDGLLTMTIKAVNSPTLITS